MKKIKLIYLLPALCLSSCSGFSPSGVYEFRLGKTDGAHFGISVNLKDDAYTRYEGTKEMSLTLDLGSDFSIEKIAEEYKEEYPLLEPIITKAISMIPEDKTLPGYYSLTDLKHPTYGTRVKIGSDYLADKIYQEFPEIQEYVDINEFTSPEMVEKIACAYVNEKQFTLQIPVSTDDVIQQLAWYGLYIDTEGAALMTNFDLDRLPGEKGEARYGTHPAKTKDEKGNVVADEVDMMNEEFEFEFSHTYLYHTDEIGIRYAVGSFLTRNDEDGARALYFKPFDDSMSLQNIEGELSIKENDLGLTTYQAIKFSAVPHSKEVSVTYNGKKGAEEGFTDANGTEFTFNSFMRKPFVFRDFHDVKVGLAKI